MGFIAGVVDVVAGGPDVGGGGAFVVVVILVVVVVVLDDEGVSVVVVDCGGVEDTVGVVGGSDVVVVVGFDGVAEFVDVDRSVVLVVTSVEAPEMECFVTDFFSRCALPPPRRCLRHRTDFEFISGAYLIIRFVFSSYNSDFFLRHLP